MPDPRPEIPPAQLHREAAQTATQHLGPTADHYTSALERYVEAMAATERPPHRVGPSRITFPPLSVGDVMRRDVVAAYPNALFKEIAHALERNGIDAVPVIDEERRVIGVVSESDLLARVAGARPVPRGHRRYAHREARHKRRATTALELMTARPITVPPSMPIADAARLAARSRVRNLPVVTPSGTLAGMVARRDLIRLFLRPDAEIRAAVVRDVVRAETHTDRRHVQVNVDEGVVTFAGRVRNALTARRLVYDAKRLPGVIDVHDELDFDVDDSVLPRRS